MTLHARRSPHNSSTQLETALSSNSRLSQQHGGFQGKLCLNKDADVVKECCQRAVATSVLRVEDMIHLHQVIITEA